MFSRPVKLAIAALGAGAMVLGTTSIVSASVAPNTTVKAKLLAGTNMTFNGTISGIPITVTCTTFKDKTKVVAGDTTHMNIPPVTIKGCTDSLGGTDTIHTNDTNGSWQLKIASASSPLELVVPKKGATFTSTAAPAGCVITVAPTSAQDIDGTYTSSNGEDTVSNSSFAVGGNSDCSASSSSASATVKFSPNPGTIPPFVT